MERDCGQCELRDGLLRGMGSRDVRDENCGGEGARRKTPKGNAKGRMSGDALGCCDRPDAGQESARLPSGGGSRTLCRDWRTEAIRVTAWWVSWLPANMVWWPQDKVHSGVPAMSRAVARSGGQLMTLRMEREHALRQFASRDDGKSEEKCRAGCRVHAARRPSSAMMPHVLLEIVW